MPTMTVLAVTTILLIIFGVAIWDLVRPVRRTREDRLRASLGPARRHQEARWRDEDGA